MKNSGFTLIELIITISILAVILSISVPKLSMDFKYMDKAASEFVSDVRYIQLESMMHPNSKFEIVIIKNPCCYYIKKNSVFEKTVKFKDRYLINYSNTGSIRFSNEGTPINAGTFTITDTKTNEVKSVSIVPTTGRTIIKE